MPMPCMRQDGGTAPQHSGGRPRVRLDAADDIDGPSASSADHTRRPGLNNLFSGTASAALFASLALCLLLVCGYSYVARRRAISGARRRFLGRVRDLELVPGRGRPSRRADVPRVAKTLSPAARAADSSSGPAAAGDCPVCLEPLRGADDVAAAHACGHVFHARCIESWLDRCDSCPVCRCTVSCGLDPASEAATTVVGGACRLPLPETVVVVIAAETAAWATGSDDDEMMRRSTTSTGAVVTAQ